MKMKKMISALLLGSMLLTACGGGSKNEKKAEKKVEEKKDNASTAGKKIKYIMVTDTGGVHDQSFNQSAYEGLETLKKDGVAEISYIESKQASDYKTNIETAVDSKSDLIATIGFLLHDATLEAAKSNEDQKFLIIDSPIKGQKNVVGTVFADNENSYLIGYLAGSLTQTNKVGFVGGEKSALIDRFEAGFRAGVEQAAKDNNKTVEIVTQHTDSFSDQSKGKAVANGMYASGVDHIYHAAGNSGNGVIESAKENKKFVYGVDRDQSYLAPEYVVASAIKKVNEAIIQVGKALHDGKFQGGEVLTFSTANNGVDIAYGKSKIDIPKTLVEKIEELKKGIASGTIKVPTELK